MTPASPFATLYPNLPAYPSAPWVRSRASRRECLAALGLTGVALAGAAPSLGVAPVTAATPQTHRLVAAGGAITEILYALGLQDRLVGVDTTSQHPPEALKEKAGIGYVRALSAEGVLSLRPTLVLALDGAGPPDALKLVAEAGGALARIPDAPGEAGTVARIEAVGQAVGAGHAAARLAAQARTRFAELADLRQKLPPRRRVLFVLSLQNGRALVGGRGSSAAEIIALAGGVNAADAVEGFKPMTDEAIVAAAPDVVLMMRGGAGHALGPDQLFALPAFAQIPAAAKRAHLVMDGSYLLGFGPRAPLAARDLMAALYPEASVPPLPTAAAP